MFAYCSSAAVVAAVVSSLLVWLFLAQVLNSYASMALCVARCGFRFCVAGGFLLVVVSAARPGSHGNSAARVAQQPSSMA